jgi:hypothetical protein
MVYLLLWINVCWLLIGKCLALDILLDFHHNLGAGFQKAGTLNATLEQSQVCTRLAQLGTPQSNGMAGNPRFSSPE